MRFGAFVPQSWRWDLVGIPVEGQWPTMVRVAKTIEEAVYESLWVYDHLHALPRPKWETDQRALPTAQARATSFEARTLGEHRRAAGYGIREAAAIIGIDRGHLSRIERGHRYPSPEVAERIAELYQLPGAISDRLMAAAALTRAYGRSIGLR